MKGMTKVEKSIYKNKLLISSCEAKLKRIEPLSKEYNETMELIDKALDQIQELEIEKQKDDDPYKNFPRLEE